MTRQDLGHGVTLISRDEWAIGRSVQPTESRDPHSIDEFIVHHSGGVELGDPDLLQWARNIYDYHVHTLRYAAEAYEAFIGEHADGSTFILEGRPIGLVSAATYMHNQRGYAACYLRANNDSERDFFVPDNIKVAYRLLAQIVAFTLGHTIVGTDHADCKPDSTSCAGLDLNNWVRTGGLWVPFPQPANGKPTPKLAPKPAPRPPVTGPVTGWPAFPGVVLKKGMGPSGLVAAWQMRMNALGAHLLVDGKFGEETYKVTAFFQGVHHLSTDGEVGPVTWAAAR